MSGQISEDQRSEYDFSSATQGKLRHRFGRGGEGTMSLEELEAKRAAAVRACWTAA